MAGDTGAAPNPGLGVDSSGNPVIDPTANVLNLVEAAVRRLDDLREAEAAHVREMVDLRSDYERQLRVAESNRIDAIRAVDVGAVNRAAEVAATQATVLAAQLQATAEAARVGLVQALEPIQKDIQDLRKAQYEIAGAKANVGETRLNLGSILGVASVFLVILFGVSGVALTLLIR